MAGYANTTSSLVDTTSGIKTLVDRITNLPIDPPSLYFDLEGVKLCREGSISIFQLLVQPHNHVYLIDIHILGSDAFTTAGLNATTFQDILQSSNIQKVGFDIRNDSDALFAHFGIALDGIQDVQLMENAGRPHGRKRLLNGLAKCIDRDLLLNTGAKQSWKANKDRGLNLFHPDRGGSYEVFNVRPLREELKEYCVQDVLFLPALRNTYLSRLSPLWKQKVDVETRRRVLSSQASDYQPNNPNKSLGPWPSM